MNATKAVAREMPEKFRSEWDLYPVLCNARAVKLSGQLAAGHFLAPL